MSLAESIVRRLANHPAHSRSFVAQHVDPAVPAQLGPWPDWVPESIINAAGTRGVDSIYSHQSRALAAIGEGRDVVLSTPTASGKTLVYNVATVAACMESAAARALYLFPTKALARDQVVELAGFSRACGIEVGAAPYDGDTPADARRSIRAASRVVVTNPDMLHCGILPHHDRWHGLLSGLKYVVIDELHVYRGVFGSHVANVLRRLKRICAFHGSDPRFIMCSATIANAEAHGSAIIERPAELISGSGAPRGRRAFYLYNPPLVDGSKGIRGSYVQAARRVARALAKAEVPTIVFANSRLAVERLTRHLQEDVARDGGDPESVAGYRGGYLPDHRRAVESGLRTGRIQTVVSTSALELGVDVGQLEACVMAGYPGSIASTMQRAGRAGRREAPSTVVMVARSEPVDQYLVSHPEALFERSPEHARIEANNLLIVSDHIKCAAFELPFEVGEAFGAFDAETTGQVLRWLANRALLHEGLRRWQWTGAPYPAHGVGLRGVAEGNFTVLDIDHGYRIIAEVDYHATPTTLYEQAIYIVGGRTYQVLRLDWEGRRAEVRPVHVDYFTDSMTFSGARALSTFDSLDAPVVSVAHGEALVFERVMGFKKIRFATGENVGWGEVRLPENELHTTALWLRPTDALMTKPGFARHRVVDALEGLGNALKRVATVHLMCDSSDLGLAMVGREEAARDADGLPTLYLYERYPGGVGFHQQLFESINVLLGNADRLLAGCACSDGCPTCVGAPATLGHEADQPRSRDFARQVLAVIRHGLVAAFERLPCLEVRA